MRGLVERVALLPVLGAFLCALFVVVYAGRVGVEPSDAVPFSALAASSATSGGSALADGARDAAADTAPDAPDGTAPTPGVQGRSADRFRARSLWALADLAYLLAVAAVVGLAAWILREAGPGLRPGRWPEWIAAAVAFSPLLLPLVLGWSFLIDTSRSRWLDSYIGLLGDVREGMRGLTAVGNVATFAALGLALVALQALLGRAPSATEPAADPVRALKARVRRFDALLAAGSAMMTTGVLEVYALFSWPLALVRPDERAGAEVVAQTMTLVAGGLLTLFLVAVFVPTGWILQQRIAALAESRWPEASASDRAERLKAEGVQLRLPARLLTALKALAPLLVGTGMARVVEPLLR